MRTAIWSNWRSLAAGTKTGETAADVTTAETVVGVMTEEDADAMTAEAAGPTAGTLSGSASAPGGSGAITGGFASR